MRSMLFVPGDSPRKIEKGLSSEADAIIIDLEDSVSLAAKPEARRLTSDVLIDLAKNSASTRHPEVYVRVNALDTGMAREDLAAVVPGGPDGIIQPKTRSADDVLELLSLIDTLKPDTASGITGAKGSISVVIIATETAASLFHMGSYMTVGSRLTGLSWGAEDLSADLGAATNRTSDGSYTDPYRLARSLCLFAAVAADAQPIDTVYTNFRDEAGLRAECKAAMRDGFTGKLAIHPGQIATINEVFTPSSRDVSRAGAIVEAFEAAGNPGVVGLDGEMLDRPHLTRALNLIARAERYR